MNRLPFTMLSKGRYWYFRRNGLLSSLPGAPGDEKFQRRYTVLLRHSDQARAEDEAARAKATNKRAHRAEARRKRNLTRADASLLGMVYFIGANSGPIKIGFTKDLAKRLKRIQMTSAIRIRVLASFPGTPRDELDLHQQWSLIRLHGEWFKRTPELAEFVGRIFEEQTLASVNKRPYRAGNESGTYSATAILTGFASEN